MEEERTKCDIYSRSMGYIRPTKNYNKGKLQEFKDRETFNEKESCERTSSLEIATEE